MVDSKISLDNLKSFFRSQVYDEEKWAHNMVSSLSLSLFLVNIFFVLFVGLITREYLWELISFMVFPFLVETVACCWAVRRINFSDAQLWRSYGNLRNVVRAAILS
ncbi:hypothetical protein EZV62_024135 [Acer yangbiense]|uniref:Uncharacterized protein n=1 Tax=Acer yangbiense TaxID=1000413 RepID=A0A5C7H3W6_9ROSI|nr:hypothetical protein EZV62_024135 [Acer yangbiense]